jgi:hypothetical protein
MAADRSPTAFATRARPTSSAPSALLLRKQGVVQCDLASGAREVELGKETLVERNLEMRPVVGRVLR